MSNRKDFFYRQLVSEADLDGAFNDLEVADRSIMVDAAIVGIVSGLAVAQHAPTPDLTVDVGAGAAYDQLGQRLGVAALQTVSVATDSVGVNTAVGPGNERWIAIFLRFARTLSDSQLDGNNVTVFFERQESFTIERVQGAEAAIGAATRPTLGTDKILLADVRRTNGQTQVLNADISTTRRESAFKFAAGNYAVEATSAESSDAAVLAHFNAFALALASQVGDGAAMVGAAAGTGGLTAGTVRSQLNQLGTAAAGLTASLAGKANLSGGNSFAGAQLMGSSLAVAGAVDIDGTLTVGGDITIDKVGAFLISLANSVTTAEIRHLILGGTGAANGQNLVLHTQPGQGQSGGSNNNHGGHLEVILGERGTGGSGTDGRLGGFLLRGENNGNGHGWYHLVGRSVGVPGTGALTTIFIFDALREGVIAGAAPSNVYDVTVRINLIETAAPPQQVRTLEVEATFVYQSGVMTQVGTTTNTGHNKGNLSGITANCDSTGANTQFRVTVQSSTLACSARAFVEVRQHIG